jgi:prenyltransferase beta subunit
MAPATVPKILAGGIVRTVVAAVLAAAVIAWAPADMQADKPLPALAKYDKDVDAAIDKALAYLAKNQLADGSFVCPMPGNTAVTSLSVMAFLAKGYTPGSGPYGKVIDRAIDHVLSCQNPSGMLVNPRGQSHGPMYCHGIATLMLSEVSGMVTPARQEKIDKALAKALNVILVAQKIPKNHPNSGGWRYHQTSNDSDISCTGWQLMALRSARNSGAPVPKEAIDKAVQYVLGLRCPDGGFGYASPGDPGMARTGTALLCLELCGKHGDPVTAKAGDWIAAHMPLRYGDGFFYYGLYYCSQGMFQLGGAHWEKWATAMYETLLKIQQADGSWPSGQSSEAPAGPCFSTAMGVLAMGVSYRQLPIYQR